MNDESWASHLPVAQVRVARATNHLDRIIKFYRDGLGLQEVTSFSEHDGYSGVMLGLPGRAYHLEFTQYKNGEQRPKPDKDDLLVLYIPDRQAIGRLVVRMGALGYFPVPPKNPFWEDRGVTLEDPDGWRVVLVESEGL